MKLWVTATFVAQYNLAIVVGQGSGLKSNEFGYDSEHPYGSISHNSTGMNVLRLYTNVGNTTSYLRVQSGPSFPKTARRLDNGTSVTFTANGIGTRAALFGEGDLNKTVYLSVS